MLAQCWSGGWRHRVTQGRPRSSAVSFLIRPDPEHPISFWACVSPAPKHNRISLWVFTDLSPSLPSPAWSPTMPGRSACTFCPIFSVAAPTWALLFTDTNAFPLADCSTSSANQPPFKFLIQSCCQDLEETSEGISSPPAIALVPSSRTWLGRVASDVLRHSSVQPGMLGKDGAKVEGRGAIC